MVEKTMSASQFKARRLRVLDDVTRQRVTVVVTKRGKPVARVLPAASKRRSSVFGFGRGYVRDRRPDLPHARALGSASRVGPG